MGTSGTLALASVVSKTQTNGDAQRLRQHHAD